MYQATGNFKISGGINPNGVAETRVIKYKSAGT
jgi:hypothetical protein